MRDPISRPIPESPIDAPEPRALREPHFEETPQSRSCGPILASCWLPYVEPQRTVVWPFVTCDQILTEYQEEK